MLEHPLLNSVILTNVFKYCDVEDLPDYRLVCNTWFDVSLAWWRKTKTLTVLQTKDDEKPEIAQNAVGRLRKSSGVSLEELRRIHSGFLRLDSKPFSNYRLKKWRFEDQLTDKCFTETTELKILPLPGSRKGQIDPENKSFFCGRKSYANFRQKFGSRIKRLHFDECSFPYTCGHPYLIFFIIFTLTPNIESLNMRQCAINETHMETLLTRQWHLDERIAFRLAHFKPLTKLKEIRIDGNFSAGVLKLHQFFPNLETIAGHFLNSPSLQSTIWRFEKSGVGERPLQIKTLDILHDDASDKAVWDPTLQVGPGFFIDLKVNTESFPLLTTLALGTMSSNIDPFMCNVDSILEDFSDAKLKKLKLFVAPYTAPVWCMCLSLQIESLKEVELYGNCYGSLEFLKWMPNLERVHISTWATEMSDKIRQYVLNNGHRRKVVNFRTNIILNTAKENVLDGFVAMNLTHFHLDCPAFPQDLVCLSEWMPYLRCLKIVLKDEGLAVVCNSYANSSWANLEELHLLYGSLPSDDGIVKMVSLKNLKIFRFDTYCNGSAIGDKSAIEGFLKMDNLHTLEICVSANLSPEIEDKLKEKIDRATIIRNYGNHEAHHRYGKCCKQLQFVCCLLNPKQKAKRTYRPESN